MALFGTVITSWWYHRICEKMAFRSLQASLVALQSVAFADMFQALKILISTLISFSRRALWGVCGQAYAAMTLRILSSGWCSIKTRPGCDHIASHSTAPALRAEHVASPQERNHFTGGLDHVIHQSDQGIPHLKGLTEPLLDIPTSIPW